MARQCLYGAARIGDIVVKLNLRPTPGWTVVLLSVIALSLAGCGRKGALDLPPSASGGPALSAASPETEAEAANKPNLFNANPADDSGPTAAKGRKRSFVLDPILGEDYPRR
jgi:predicted small lipoprotein YifL